VTNNLSENDLNILFQGLIACPVLIEKAIPKLTADDFFPQERYIFVVWLKVRDWYEKNGEIIPYGVLAASLLDLAKDQASDFREDECEKALHLIAEVKSSDENFSSKGYSEHLISLLRIFLNKRRLSPLVESLSRSTNIVKDLENINDVSSKISVNSLEIICPFDDDEMIMSDSVRIPFGVPFYDKISDGGNALGETVLVLAPPGGGKTLLNVQMSVSTALRGDYSLILSYEQGIRGDISKRIYAFALGMDIANFTVDPSVKKDMDPRVREAYKMKKEQIQKRFMAISMEEVIANKGSCNGANDVRDVLQELKISGITPRYVGVDWFGPMIESYAGAVSGNKQKHELMMGEMRKLSQISREFNTNVFVYHQLTTTAATSKLLKVPSQHDSLDCRNLCNFASTVVAFSPRNPDHDIAIVGVPKNRDAKPFGHAYALLNGPKSRWELLEDDAVTVSRDGSNIIITDANTNLVVTPQSVAAQEYADNTLY